MTDSVPTEDDDFEQVIDQISDKIADSLISKATRWATRTAIGLTLFGTLWHFFDWGFWLFAGYAVLAPVSLILLVYSHHRMAKLVASTGDKI